MLIEAQSGSPVNQERTREEIINNALSMGLEIEILSACGERGSPRVKDLAIKVSKMWATVLDLPKKNVLPVPDKPRAMEIAIVPAASDRPIRIDVLREKDELSKREKDLRVRHQKKGLPKFFYDDSSILIRNVKMKLNKLNEVDNDKDRPTNPELLGLVSERYDLMVRLHFNLTGDSLSLQEKKDIQLQIDEVSARISAYRNE